MKRKIFSLVLFGILLCGCDNSPSSVSLGGGVLIPNSEYNPISSETSTTTSSSVNEKVLSDCFVGRFIGEDQIMQSETTLEVNAEGVAKFTNDYGNSFEFTFVEENTGEYSKYARFISSDEMTLLMENGPSFMFVTVNDGIMLDDTCCLYDGATFVRGNYNEKNMVFSDFNDAL